MATKKARARESVSSGEKEKVKRVKMPDRVPRTEREIAMDFATKAHEKFAHLLKASILFGSQAAAKSNATTGSDIDIVLIVDDASISWDAELVAWYREELGKLITAQNYAKDLHINTVRLTTWWEDLLHGDPVVINVLRYGEALIDIGGFFKPLKALLLNGKIRSTPEAVYAALQRAPLHLARSKSAELGAVEGVYWTMVDAAQAALMTAGKIPPSPEHLPEMLYQTFVEAGMLKKSYVEQMKEIYALHKAILHKQMNEIKGEVIDRWQKIAEDFLMQMTRIIDTLIESYKKSNK
ncbi:nucleotidyltransferase domain-containing protein [Candidatus Pacearchaeota archaeon]|nr:MAG: nucleotidyltransferase domain-containing protein [Candidatus Pacearchaeota archaeon]